VACTGSPAKTVVGLAEQDAVGGAASILPVMETLAVAALVPPGPFAVRVYVIVSSTGPNVGGVNDSVGFTCIEPFRETGPIPSMATSVASVVDQLSVTGWPFLISAGLTSRKASGDGGGGGGGGGGVCVSGG